MLSGISKPITPVGEENKQGKRRQGEILEVGGGGRGVVWGWVLET